MIRGMQVTVIRKTPNGVDDMNMPIFSEAEETIDDVLTSPVGSDDIPNGMRELGDRTVMALHFPKTYTESLRNCSVVFADKVWRVTGDPQPYMLENTPTRWNRKAIVELVEG